MSRSVGYGVFPLLIDFRAREAASAIMCPYAHSNVWRKYQPIKQKTRADF